MEERGKVKWLALLSNIFIVSLPRLIVFLRIFIATQVVSSVKRKQHAERQVLKKVMAMSTFYNVQKGKKSIHCGSVDSIIDEDNTYKINQKEHWLWIPLAHLESS